MKNNHQRQNSTTKQQTSSPPNIPILTRWTLNSNNTITGYISNSSTIKDGNKITTSVITGSTNGGSIVETKSNSKYYLSVSTVVPKRQGAGIRSSYIPSSDVSVASSLSSAASSVQSRAYQAIRGGSESTARKFFKLPPKIRKLILFSLLILIATLVTQNLQREMQSFNINAAELSSIDKPISICDRMAPISHEEDIRITQKYNSQCMMNKSPPQNTTLLLLGSEKSTWGRTGNNLIEFLHAMQYAKDNNMIVGIMQVSWPTYMITQMWMSIQTNVRNRGIPECVNDGTIQSARACDRALVRSKQRAQAIDEWITLFESSFCIKILSETEEDDLSQYKQVVTLSTKDLFEYQHEYTVTATDNSGFTDYVEYQSHIIRTLFKHYNDGIGINMHNEPVGDMCSVLNAMFGKDKDTIMYSVIHSRSLEGLPGQRMLAKIAERSGCDPTAALDMNPHYVKSVLKPAGMLGYPIIFITDNQRPEILQKLLEDVQLGPHIRLIPEEASWLGGDITIAIMSTVFIGNPASTLSGFIAKSRVALGYKTNYLFRRKVDEGTQWFEGQWFDVCDHECIFNKNVMRSMA